MGIPNNPAVKVGDSVYFGGIAPIGENGSVEDKFNMHQQVKVILSRMESYLKKTNMNLTNLVYITVYISDLSLYKEMNDSYSEYMPEPYPARKVIQAPMTLEGMVIEMTGVASREEKEIL